MQKRIRHPLARLSQTSAASVYCKRPPRVWRAKGKLALTTVITTSIATTRRRCSCSRGLKPRCAIPTCVRNNTAALRRSPAIRPTKIKPSTSSCACGKRATGCRRCPWGPKISVVPVCLMRNTSWPAKPGARSTSRSAWDGAISAPAVT